MKTQSIQMAKQSIRISKASKAVGGSKSSIIPSYGKELSYLANDIN